MSALTNETRKQCTEGHHVVNYMEEMVELRLDVGRVQLGEQLCVFANEAAEPVYVVHGHRRSQLEDAADDVEAPQAVQVV